MAARGRTRPASLAWWQGLPVRWIAFDQRGCGRSTPAGQTAHNDLARLLDDIDHLREHLGLERWSIAAGSWGATLALAWLLRHPARLEGLYLRSPFMGGRDELQRYLADWPAWLGPQGQARLGPAAQAFERWWFGPHDGVAAESVWTPQQEAWLANAWGGFDDLQSAPGGVAAAGRSWQPVEAQGSPPTPPSSWQVFRHYARHVFFLAQPLWPALMQLPASQRPRCMAVVTGMDDRCCDPAVAQALARWHGRARLREVPDGGHRMDQPSMAQALHETARTWVADLEDAAQLDAFQCSLR